MERPVYFLPSEVARLVLGYLKETQHVQSYKCFLHECKHLSEYADMLKQGIEYPTTIMGISLVNILEEYAKLKLKDTQEGLVGVDIGAVWKQLHAVTKTAKQKSDTSSVFPQPRQRSRRSSAVCSSTTVNSLNRSPVGANRDSRVAAVIPCASAKSGPAVKKSGVFTHVKLSSQMFTLTPSISGIALNQLQLPAATDSTMLASGKTSEQNVSTHKKKRKRGTKKLLSCRKKSGKKHDSNGSVIEGSECGVSEREETFSEYGDIGESLPGLNVENVLVRRKDLLLKDADVVPANNNKLFQVKTKKDNRRQQTEDIDHLSDDNSSRNDAAFDITHHTDIDLDIGADPVAVRTEEDSVDWRRRSPLHQDLTETSQTDSHALHIDQQSPVKMTSLEQLHVHRTPVKALVHDSMTCDSGKSPRRRKHQPKRRGDIQELPPPHPQPPILPPTEVNNKEEVAGQADPFPILLEKIMNDTKLHERLAETINKSRITDHPHVQCHKQVATSTIVDDFFSPCEHNMLSEDTIDGIINMTKNDPLFDSLLSMFGPEATKTVVSTSSVLSHTTTAPKISAEFVPDHDMMELSQDGFTTSVMASSAHTLTYPGCSDNNSRPLTSPCPSLTSPCPSLSSSVGSPGQVPQQRKRRIRPTPCNPLTSVLPVFSSPVMHESSPAATPEPCSPAPSLEAIHQQLASPGVPHSSSTARSGLMSPPAYIPSSHTPVSSPAPTPVHNSTSSDGQQNLMSPPSDLPIHRTVSCTQSPAPSLTHRQQVSPQEPSAETGHQPFSLHIPPSQTHGHPCSPHVTLAASSVTHQQPASPQVPPSPASSIATQPPASPFFPPASPLISYVHQPTLTHVASNQQPASPQVPSSHPPGSPFMQPDSPLILSTMPIVHNVSSASTMDLHSQALSQEVVTTSVLQSQSGVSTAVAQTSNLVSLSSINKQTSEASAPTETVQSALNSNQHSNMSVQSLQTTSTATSFTATEGHQFVTVSGMDCVTTTSYNDKSSVTPVPVSSMSVSGSQQFQGLVMLASAATDNQKTFQVLPSKEVNPVSQTPGNSIPPQVRVQSLTAEPTVVSSHSETPMCGVNISIRENGIIEAFSKGKMSTCRRILPLTSIPRVSVISSESPPPGQSQPDSSTVSSQSQSVPGNLQTVTTLPDSIITTPPAPPPTVTDAQSILGPLASGSFPPGMSDTLVSSNTQMSFDLLAENNLSQFAFPSPSKGGGASPSPNVSYPTVVINDQVYELTMSPGSHNLSVKNPRPLVETQLNSQPTVTVIAPQLPKVKPSVSRRRTKKKQDTIPSSSPRLSVLSHIVRQRFTPNGKKSGDVSNSLGSASKSGLPSDGYFISPNRSDTGGASTAAQTGDYVAIPLGRICEEVPKRNLSFGAGSDASSQPADQNGKKVNNKTSISVKTNKGTKPKRQTAKVNKSSKDKGRAASQTMNSCDSKVSDRGQVQDKIKENAEKTTNLRVTKPSIVGLRNCTVSMTPLKQKNIHSAVGNRLIQVTSIKSRSTDQTVSQSPGQISLSTGQTSSQSTGQIVSQSTGQTSSKATGQASSQSTGQTVSQSPSQSIRSLGGSSSSASVKDLEPICSKNLVENDRKSNEQTKTCNSGQSQRDLKKSQNNSLSSALVSLKKASLKQGSLQNIASKESMPSKEMFSREVTSSSTPKTIRKSGNKIQDLNGNCGAASEDSNMSQDSSIMTAASDPGPVLEKGVPVGMRGRKMVNMTLSAQTQQHVNGRPMSILSGNRKRSSSQVSLDQNDAEKFGKKKKVISLEKINLDDFVSRIHQKL